jgi:hypothetical protein
MTLLSPTSSERMSVPPPPTSSRSSSHLSFNIAIADAPLLGGGLNSDGSFITPDGLTVEATEGEPIFVATPGEFGATLSHEQQDFGFSYTFTEVAPGAAVPEASIWTMMALGFLGLGYAGYRRSRDPRRAPPSLFWT